MRMTFRRDARNNLSAQTHRAEARRVCVWNETEGDDDKKNLTLVALVGPLALASLAYGATDPDAGFRKKAAEGGIFEVDTGSEAQKTDNDQQVKDLGSMLVTDHTAANDKLKALAASKDISLPTTSSLGAPGGRRLRGLSTRARGAETAPCSGFPRRFWISRSCPLPRPRSRVRAAVRSASGWIWARSPGRGPGT